jgi:hypothetical protein
MVVARPQVNGPGSLKEDSQEMNAIALFLMLVLQGNSTCPAKAPDHMSLPTTNGDQTVQVQQFDCYWRGEDSPSHRFIVVSPVCDGYIAQPIVVKEVNERKGWVMNRFGEFYPASVNVELMDVYKPPC